MAPAPTSDGDWTGAGSPGRSGSPAPSWSIRPRSDCARRCRRPDARPSTQCRAVYRARSLRCWRRSVGSASPGGAAPRARSAPASPPSGCASPTAHGTPTTPACRATVEGTALDGLVGEWRDSGEKKYYLSNLPRRTTLRRLDATVKARWACEQAHQQLKQELGLADFEGRSWTGLHRHALMTCIAFAYLQHRRLKAAGRGEKGGPQRAAAAALAA